MRESLADSPIREVREETGFEIEVTGLIGTCTDPPGHIIAYSDGEVRRQVNLCYRARIVGGQMSDAPQQQVHRQQTLRP